ncbi:hypothetical protein [Escherichia coli]|uniref:RNA polymerase beta n=1 Tax=Escherichia coli 3.4880 TaxID=1051347 RepID=A0AAV3HWL9_ECOLX|nr:hypothetical protein [Escherichia coli]EKK47017.1 hypothetical protein EC80566_1338 [Escherichia coli 8.0566]EKK47609.1 hypothetical protein EC80569_1292 [Escherichia coli 8.0569]ELW25401.1 putative rNA polymerase beta [Escherichia coli 3.4880]
MLRIGQVEATATQDGKYTDGSVAGGIAATRLRAAAFNAMQEELAHIVESAGLALDINDMTQVLKAIQKLTLSRINPFADIKSDGAAAISTALANLDLGEAAKRDVGTGENQIPDMNAWSHSGPATGRWRKSPDGLIEQWGSAGISDAYGNAAVTFPIAFSSEPDFVLFGPRNVTAPTRMTSIVLDESQLRNTGFTCRCFDHLDGSTTPSTSNFYWYCRGY